MGREINSFSMEDSTESDISSERIRLEKEFHQELLSKERRPERKELLSLAKAGEGGTGKRLVIEWMKKSENLTNYKSEQYNV